MIKLNLSNEEIHNLTKDEIEIAKARKLEILMLPHLRRNIAFFYAGANIPKKAEAYNKPIKQEDLLNEIATGKKSLSVVCKPLCFFASEILRENGIQAEPVSCDTDIFRHTDVLVTTSSGKKYIINYLEDMENVQTGMTTPDFASEAYYERRYKKFEGGLTTDGKSLEGISFLSEEQISKIDENLKYKKCGMYMDAVIQQIKNEFVRFREVMSENEYLTALRRKEKNGELSEVQKEELKKEWIARYEKRSDDMLLEEKLDWLFRYFNERMDITGYTDFVMYYSRLLLSKVLSEEEYKKITRYSCFAHRNDIPANSDIIDVLDLDNSENNSKVRFSLIKLKNVGYVFSTKPNVYKKLTPLEMEKLESYSVLSKSEKPSELVLMLCDKGNALPLVFHPLGSEILNKRAAMIDSELSAKEKEAALQKLANSIIATDGERTSLTVPYPDGSQKYIYLDENNEFVVQTKTRKTIHHYNEETDTFDKEISFYQDR